MYLQIRNTIFIIIFLVACVNRESKIKSNESIIIDIQPFSDIDTTKSNFIYVELKKIYPLVHLNKPINFPKTAYRVSKNRYRADSLINYLNFNTANNHITIGLTKKDISTTKEKIEDWGIMGLGFCPGKACIASSFRLSKKKELQQLFKVAIHELGHTQGLPHCSERNCFMRDAEGKNTTNDETEFCIKCKTQLKNKGWLL